jgi:SAM-dependent methyltransferase
MPSATSEELDALYARDPDPWRFRTSDYEAAKFAHTLACLPRARYRHALEVGCSIAVLGRLLAERCDRYLGIDASRRALALAEAEARPGMRFLHLVVPQSFPDGRFDLVLLSEILYFLGPRDVAQLAARVIEAAPGGDVVCVNTRHPTDRELDGLTALGLFGAAFGRRPARTWTTKDYRIDVFPSAGVGAGA